MKIVVVGASGAIGSEIVKQLADKGAEVYALHRRGDVPTGELITSIKVDITDEKSVQAAAEKIGGELDGVIITTGILHQDNLQPEKALKDITAEHFAKVYAVNTIGVALVAKHFAPLLKRNEKAIFAAISARVGSIQDNHLGGWYAYRMSKAALNMFIKTASIEIARKYKKAVVVGLHPGTVDSNLSKPFQGHVPEGKLFTPAYSAQKLLAVLENLDATQTGLVFDYDGKQVPA